MTIIKQIFTFFKQVLIDFRANQGVLLSGAVAYYSLLSIVPMTALVLLILSQFVDQQELLENIQLYLDLATANQADQLLPVMQKFLEDWHKLGAIGLLMLLIFSSLAFTALENAMSVIFHHRVTIHRRHFLVSAIMPYVYIILLTFGLLTISVISTLLYASEDASFQFLDMTFTLTDTSSTVIYLLGLFGEILLLTSLYLAMPVGRLVFRHALIGGILAAFLWEITRHILVWWFSTLSVVDVIYGSFTSAIVILLSFELAAIIVLLGAQTIAEFERRDNGETDSPEMTT